MSFDDLDRLLGEQDPKIGGSRRRNEEEKRPCVLIVDDDSFILRAVHRVLSRFYDVTTALSAEEALSALTDVHAAVLLDIRMPVHDGFWACDRIRRSRPDIPIIFHTAHQSDKDISLIQAEHKPFAYLFKDGDVDRLLLTVAAAIESRRGAGSSSPV